MLLEKEERRRRWPDGHGEKRGRRSFDGMLGSSMPALSEQTEALLPAGDGLEVISNPLSSEEPYMVMSTGV